MTTTALEKRPLRRLRRLIPSWNWNSPLDSFFRNDFPDLLDYDNVATIPAINITEEKDNYIVNLAAPGLKKEDFDINLDGNLLTISAETETETETNGRESNGFSRREYNYSSFSRTITLPDYADDKNISAKYNEGILKLTIPKKPEAQRAKGQRIKIQ